jgi:hypothetical protein
MQESTEHQQHVQSYWRSAGLVGIIFGLIGFYDPAKDLYARFFNPDYSEVESVALAQQQQRLQQKNLLCAVNMTRRAVGGEHDTSIRYGVCDNNDVLVEVYPVDKPAFQQWLSPENIAGMQASKKASLFGSAYAAILLRRPADEPISHPAQMILKTVCQKWEDSSRQVRMIRVTNEGGKCFRERINVLSGRVEVREEVPCDTQCDVKKAGVE